jgi:hypothetical protein
MDAERAELERRIATLDWAAIKGVVLELADSPATPVPLADIEAFERQCGISLPDDYREFQQIIGTFESDDPLDLVPFGCGAPDDGGLFWNYPRLTDEECAWLRLPFPLRNTDDEDDDDDDDDEAEECWDWGPEGLLPLVANVDVGCSTYSAYLVVTGDERGRVWEHDKDGMHPAETRLGRPVSFREWYAEWIIDAIDRRLPAIREERKIPKDRFATEAELAALRDLSRR